MGSENKRIVEKEEIKKCGSDEGVRMSGRGKKTERERKGKITKERIIKSDRKEK
jgi:hypothetical protein